ncbi:c-type cytochrome [Sulfurivermis fontis]|uniref:c-type cytochrome n=1 Tax=Sulfurivermis fontis TaxID=1972068 RepID=UPI000FDC6772|nr:c-type cytochrome [Sulfurivermis fontis]
MRKMLCVAGLAPALLLATPAFADQALAMQNGCLGCHKPEGKLVGPDFKQIAERYRSDPAAVEKLTAKVKAGSQPGEPLNWGQTMMPPSPAEPDNIRTIIRWMLTH